MPPYAAVLKTPESTVNVTVSSVQTLGVLKALEESDLKGGGSLHLSGGSLRASTKPELSDGECDGAPD